jgi:transketolase
MRLARPEVKELFDDSHEFKIGKATVMKEGKDAAIIATGVMVGVALEAAKSLEKENINVGVVNMSTIKPLDKSTVMRMVSETGAIITAEDHNIIGGLGSAVAEVIAENKLNVIFERIGVKDQFAESGPYKELFKKYGLDEETMVKVVRNAISKKISGQV